MSIFARKITVNPNFMGPGVSLIFSPGHHSYLSLCGWIHFVPLQYLTNIHFNIILAVELCVYIKLFSLTIPKKLLRLRRVPCGCWMRSIRPRGAMRIDMAVKQELVLSVPSEQSVFLCNILMDYKGEESSHKQRNLNSVLCNSAYFHHIYNSTVT
jgi:hypothetical protein